jgi:hypothetical protein
MEIVFEIICSFLFEGCIEIIKSKKINIIVRTALLIIITIFYAGLGICFVIGAIRITNIVGRILLVLLAILFFWLLIKLWCEVHENK